MTAQYDRSGIQFLYPENWTLTDQPDDELPRAISLEAPGGGIWSVHLYSDETDGDLLVKDTIVALEETYPDLEVTASPTSIGPPDGAAVDVIFFCLDFLVRIHLQTMEVGGQRLLLWYQAEDRDFDGTQPIFHAISTSLLQSLE